MRISTRSIVLFGIVLGVLQFPIYVRSFGHRSPIFPEGEFVTPESVNQALNRLLTDKTIPTLQELEAMALQQSPLLVQSASRVEEAQGELRQSRYYPNPRIGYLGDDIRNQQSLEGSKHGIFFEQDILLGGKVGAQRDVAELALLEAQAENDIQIFRVRNAVRLLYFQALAAELLVELKESFLVIISEANSAVEQLHANGSVNLPGRVSANLAKLQSESDLALAVNHRDQARQMLASAIGVMAVPAGRFQESLQFPGSDIDFEEVWQTLLLESPEIKKARTSLERAESIISLERKRRIPNLSIRLGIQHYQEQLPNVSIPSGLQASAEISAEIPIFDRNQGNISSARAAVEIAQAELDQITLSLRERLVTAYNKYKNTSSITRKYENQLHSETQEYCERYLKGGAELIPAYPLIITTQQNCLQIKINYISALSSMWHELLAIRGLLITSGQATVIKSY
ncbi:MAG: hypothetical protein A3F68_01695 [Acidobacteria bacterium RIFCSPLOWO2_12_FULL_54_10]|nr:MAG: hypothetical protein A3F68_01695 [Acidobacteria bacterium RIFCSPLOWO2_12_FULL_54_10]